MVLRIDDNGTVHCVHTEAIQLDTFGQLEINRASVVEFNTEEQLWEVRLLGSKTPNFAHWQRSACIAWEVEQLNTRLAAGESVLPRRAGAY